MSQLTPPLLPPRVALADGDGLQRFQHRLWLVWMTVVTILVTTWFVTLGAIPAIIALVVAKHVLVAILVRGLEVDATRRAGS
jgi:hypothetical protein